MGHLEGTGEGCVGGGIRTSVVSCSEMLLGGVRHQRD